MRQRPCASASRARSDTPAQTAADGYSAAKDKVEGTVGAARQELHERQDQAGVLADEARHKADSLAERSAPELLASA